MLHHSTPWCLDKNSSIFQVSIKIDFQFCRFPNSETLAFHKCSEYQKCFSNNRKLYRIICKLTEWIKRLRYARVFIVWVLYNFKRIAHARMWARYCATGKAKILARFFFQGVRLTLSLSGERRPSLADEPSTQPPLRANKCSSCEFRCNFFVLIFPTSTVYFTFFFLFFYPFFSQSRKPTFSFCDIC